MIYDLLKGKTPLAEMRLNKLRQETGDNPHILWYPSAGNDYRDIIETSELKATANNIAVTPQLYIHTDYMPRWVSNDSAKCDDGSVVKIIRQSELRLITDVNYYVNPDYVDFPDDANKNPVVRLLDVQITTSDGQVVEAPVLYFFFENMNFLSEVLLKDKIHISHLVKVRDGYGLGGNGKSEVALYAFLSALHARYLLADTLGQADNNIISHIKNENRIDLFDYEWQNKTKIGSWSDLRVNAFTIRYINRALSNVSFAENLKVVMGEVRME